MCIVLIIGIAGISLVFINKNNDYSLSVEVKLQINDYFEEKVLSKKENFANGRLVRNLYDDLIMSHDKRVVNIASQKKEELSLITLDDFIKRKKSI